MAPRNLSKPVIEFFERSARKPLMDGDVVRMFDGSFHYIQYVNSSGAYAVPLAAVNREIKGAVVAFTAGGKTISRNSSVEVVHPLTMGGSSAEYKRYVLMASRSSKGVAVEGKGVTFDTFDETELANAETANIDEATVSAEQGMKAMAKSKGKAAKAKAVKREKVPAKVRNCVCGCGTETTGYFAPGHDARYHGWVKKLADGRIQRNGKDAKTGEQVIGASLLNKMGLVASGEGFKAKTAEFYKQD